MVVSVVPPDQLLDSVGLLVGPSWEAAVAAVPGAVEEVVVGRSLAAPIQARVVGVQVADTPQEQGAKLVVGVAAA